jgi:hypothetical protein
MKNHLKTWASGLLLTLAVATFCWTARAGITVYTNDTGITAWDPVGGGAPFYTAVSSANLSLLTTGQGMPSPSAGSSYTVLSETFTITNGAGSLAVANMNYVLTSVGVLATFGSTNLSLHIFDVTANLTSSGSNPLQDGSATYNFTANGDLLGSGNGLTFTDPIPGERQVIFNLSTPDSIVLGAGHSYAIEIWSPASVNAVTWNRGGATPLDPGGQGMGSQDASFTVSRTTISTLGLGGNPRTFGLALYGTTTSAPMTVNTYVPAPPVSNYIVDTFDPAGVSIVTNSTLSGPVTNTYSYSGGQIGAVWTNWWGSAWTYPPGNTWDGTSDAQTNPLSGSMAINANFDTSGDDQFTVFDNFDGIYYGFNGLAITSFQCDLRFDGNSPTTVNGSVTNYGHLQFGTRTTDRLGQDYFGSIEVQAGHTNWVHVSVPINAATDTNLLSIHDVLFHLYGPYYSPALSGPMKLWVDNIKFVGPVGYTTPPPPTLLKLQPVVPALRMFAGSTTTANDRQDIATMSQSAGWIGNTPATYSVTFTNFPSATYQGYEFNIFLIPLSGLLSSYSSAYGNSYVDWDSTNVVALRIVANTTNYAATLYYKTNVPAGGANPTNVLASITSPVAVGTWALTFSSATSGTLTTPSGSTNFNSFSAASSFANPLVAYFGVEPNSVGGEGQYVDVTEIKVSPAGVDDVFTGESGLDTTNTWTPVAVSTTSIWMAGTGTGAKYWLNWTVPDIGFGLAESTNLALSAAMASGTNWVLPSFFNGHTQSPAQSLEGNQRWALIPTNCVPPNPKSLFFVLRNPAVTN